MEWAMINFNNYDKVFELLLSNGEVYRRPRAEDVIVLAFDKETEVRADEDMDSGRLIELLAACIFAGHTLKDSQGEPFDKTPVPDAKVRYITRAEIGPVLPDGWFIEVQLNRYAAMWGEQVTLASRASLAAAIADVHSFLAASIKDATQQLEESFEAQRRLAEGQQVSMWSSSDSPQGAVD